MRVVLTANESHFVVESRDQRRREFNAERQKLIQSKKREERKTRFFGSLRRGFSLLVMMTVVVFAFAHREEIQKFVTIKLNQFAAQEAARQSAFRQSAMDNSDVNQISQ